METVLEALKAMGKATARELAARMKIDAPDALVMLREHAELGQIEHVNGWWQLIGTGTKSQTEAKPHTALPRTASIAPQVNKVNESILSELLEKHGAQTSEQLAKLAGTTVRAVASTLAMPVNKGRIVREKRGNVFHFALATPVVATVESEVVLTPEITEPTAPDSTTQSDAAFLNTIPQMAKRQAEMVCPTPKSIAAEIRRTKSRLNQLEELRITVRTLTRQQRALGL